MLTKKFAAIFLTVLMIFSLAGISASAATTTQDGLEVTLTTDKTEYKKNEQITATLKVKNTNSSVVSGVSLETLIPEGFVLADGSAATKNVGNLNADETVELTVVFGVGTSTGDGSAYNVVPVNNPVGNTAQSNVSVSAESPKTGDSTDYLGILLVLAVSGIAVGVAIKSKKKIQALSLVLGVLIISQVAMPLNLHVYADEVHKTATASVTVKMDGNDVEIIGKASYNLSSKNGAFKMGELTADEIYFVSGEDSAVVFTLEIKNSTNSVNLYKNDQKFVGTMHDDGCNGDAFANDGVFTLVVSDQVNTTTLLKNNYIAKHENDTSNIVILYYFPERPDPVESKENYDIVDSAIKKIENKYKNPDGYINDSNAEVLKKDLLDCLNEFVEEGKVAVYSIDDNGNTYIKLSSGLSLVYSPCFVSRKNKDTPGSDISMTVSTYQPCYTDMGGANFTTSMYQLPNGVNFVLEMLDDAATDINNEYQNYTFSSATNYDDESVTLDLIKSFSENQIVLWHGHGYYNSTVKSCLLTGEDFNWDKYNWDIPYFWDCVKDRIVNGLLMPFTSNKVVISSKYIEKYCGNLNNCLIYLAACHSGQTPELANAFLNKGATAVVGNSESIMRDYNVAMLYKTMENMISIRSSSMNYNTLQQALNDAKNVYGQDDSSYGGIGATPIIFGGDEANNYRFADNRVTVSGTVKDKDNNNLSGVKITLYNQNENFVQETLSSDGQYSLDITRSNESTYTLKFEKDGYITQTKSIIDVTEDRTLDVTMQKDTNNPNIPADAPTFNGHTYYLYTGYTWQEAKDYCESVGGHLATITSQEEMDFIVSDLESKSERANCYWIGLQRDGDSWKWITDEPFSYSNWAENEPNNYEDHGENVVHLFGKEYKEGKGIKYVGAWNDVTNEGAEYAADFYALQNFGYICEWDSVNKTDPLAYSQYFALEPIVSRYGSETVDEYGARLQLNDGAVVRKCAIYMYQEDGEWHRSLAFVGDNITSATYIPYVAYQGNILYDGTNHNDINTFDMYKSSDGIWNIEGNYNVLSADLEDSKGNHLTLRSKDVVGRNVQIFDDLDEMKNWLLS